MKYINNVSRKPLKFTNSQSKVSK